MAINLSDRYPGKTAGTNPEYPTGQARNVSAPGDGTGTPWDAAIVNDDQGFKQALLKEAGMTPSGNPDTALESQYLTALKNLFLGKNAISAAIGDSGHLSIPAIVGTQPRIIQIQWGSVDYSSNPGEIKVDRDFTHPFPNACFAVFLQRKMSSHTSGGDGAAHIINFTRTGFSASLQQFGGGAIAQLRGFSWLAIGA